MLRGLYKVRNYYTGPSAHAYSSTIFLVFEGMSSGSRAVKHDTRSDSALEQLMRVLHIFEPVKHDTRSDYRTLVWVYKAKGKYDAHLSARAVNASAEV